MTDERIALPPDSSQQRRTLRPEDWAAAASAADLARKATTLADRYDALPDSGDARSSRRRESVARLRAAAASAQRLITSLVVPLPPESTRRELAPSSAVRRSDPATLRDAVVARRDTAAEDLAARDDRVQSEGQVPSAPAEVTAALHSLFERLDAGRTFHQAQGILMARSGMSAADAFDALLLASTQQGVPLPEMAARMLQSGPEPDPVRTLAPASTSRGPAPGSSRR